MFLTLMFLVILSVDSSHSTIFLTRLMRNAAHKTIQQSPSLPLDEWPNDLDTASQVVFRPLFLYKHKQEEKKQNQEQKRKEQLENLNIHLIDHRQNHYFYDPYYYYYYQQYYNNNNNNNNSPQYYHPNEYSVNNNIRRQQRSYKT